MCYRNSKLENVSKKLTMITVKLLGYPTEANTKIVL